MTDLISVVVPVYNLAEYLQHSIGSILKQSYANIEVIAVDDGSSDDSLRVLKKLAQEDTRIHVLHQENSGVTKARLAGVAVANGEWIGFMDGDDEIEPDMYERLLRNAMEYHADISHCGYQMVFPSRVDYYYNTGRIYKQDRQTGLKNLIEGVFIEPSLCNKLFSKSIINCLLDNGKMDYSIKNLEDLLMNFYLFQAANISVYEDWCPYHYMVRKGSATTGAVNENKLRDPLRVFQIMKKEAENDSLLIRAVNRRMAGYLINLSTRELGSQAALIKPYRSQGRKDLRKLIPELMQETNRKKLIGMALWAAYMPSSYSLVHKLYARVKGTDKKYEVS